MPRVQTSIFAGQRPNQLACTGVANFSAQTLKPRGSIRHYCALDLH